MNFSLKQLRNILKKLLSRCNIQNNNISKIKSIKISNDDFKNNLSNQKQIIEFLLFKLNIEELINDSERQDLQLIEKHFGELFIEQSSLPLHVEKLDQIIEGLQIDDTINKITNENFNQKQLKLEEDKFQNFLNQLILIRESSQDSNQQIIEIEILIKKAEVVVETFLNCENQNIEIFKIPLCEEICDLQKIIENCKKNKDKQDNEKQNIYHESHLNKLNILNNTSDLDQFVKKDQIDDIYYQKLKKFNNYFDEKYITNLKFIIKIVKLYQIKIKEEKQVLHELLEEIQKFTSKIDFMKKYEGTIYNKMQQSFIACFEKMINNFEQKYWPINSISLQKNENQQIYFERIFANFYSIINEYEKIKNLTDDLKYPALCSQIDQGAIQKLEAKFQGKAREKSFRSQQIQIKQEILIQTVSKIYLIHNLEQEFEKDPNQQIGLFKTLIQKYKDLKNNDEWKIKQGLVFSIISISSNCFTDTIIQFCQKALIQIWIQEKDERIRNLLKNQNLITSQIQILKKDWKTQCDRISGEMQQLLHKIDDLQEQISHEYNLKKRDQQLQEVDETTQQLNEYIENISEMGQQLDLIHNFVSNIRQGLKRIEGKINQIKMQLNNMDNDIKFLRGKSVEQLLEIRKWKVLDEAAYKKIKSIYVPLKTQEKMKENIKNLMSLEEFDNKVGAVDEFLQQEKTVLLIHGMAGSGKTTAAKKIEELIWKLHENNRKINKLQLIPIYILLPSLKNPVFSAVEEALQNDYGFDQLQLKECKEMLEKKQFRFLLIMDSYDEMKLENIQKNLYINNKINQNWTNPLVIFTTRSEILTNSNYAQWFAPDDQEKLKEIQILKFDQVQKQEYLQKYTIQSIKMLIFEIYEWQIQVQNREVIDINKFEMCWEKLQSSILKYDLSMSKSETLLNQKQIESILLYLNDDEFIALKSNEAIRSLRINLQKLWSVEKYDNMMQQMNLNKFMETPYMMEIIVQVLPEMMVKAAEIVNLKQNFIKNFSKMFKDFFKSKSMIHLYNQQKKNYLIKVSNEVEKETCQENFFDQNKKWEVLQVQDCFDSTSTGLQIWEKIDNLQIALEVWNRMEENSIPSQLQISSEFNELSQKLLQIFKLNRGLPINELNKVEIKKENLIQLVFDALKEQNLTNYDFYDEFINMYHLKQIEKQRSLRKSINIDRFLHDLKQYSIKLAKTMSKKLVTQVQYQQQGLLYKDEREEEKWLNEFFNDDGQYGSYKKDIRSCSLIQQKGTNFQFVHKSIQEFLIAADLYEVLVLSKDFDIKIFRSIIEILTKQRYKEQNCEEFLSSQEHFEIYINVDNLSLFERQQKFNTWQKSIMSIINLIKILKQHDFNQINYSTEIYTETRKFLIKKISSEIKIIEFLKLIVHLTSLDKNLIQSGSNSLNILVEIKVDLTNQFFLNIRIQNTSLIGGNFAKCNLSGAEFQNININGMNLNGAQLIDCKWKNLRINDLHQLNGHDGPVNSLCFSPDGIILASGSMDQSIRLWDVGTGQQQSILEGHSNSVQSVCFSPDGSVLASGSDDKTIRLWNFKTGKQILQLNGHHAEVLSVCFSADGSTLASGDGDKTIRLWDIKNGHQKSNLEGHSNNVTSVCFSPDGTNLASASWDNTIRLWDVKSGQQMLKFDGHISYISSICFSPDGTTLASGSNDKSICLWDIKTGQQKSKLQGHSYGVYSICFSLDGTTLASGSDDNSIRLWDVKTGQQKSKLDGHTNAILSVSFSPDGIKLASACWDNSIRLWDVKTEQQKTQLEGHSSFVSSVCFSPDGTTLASGSNDSSIRLWDVKTGQQKSKLDGHSNAVLSVCFSPDGTTLASGSNDKSIRLWDIKTGQSMLKLDGHNFAVYSICFSPDCTMLSSGSDDSSIRLWDVKTGLQKLKLDGHTNAVLSVCFSPDGTILAFGSDDNSISLWDVKTEQLQLKLEGHNGWVQSVCFSPDGRILGSCSGDKSIRLWDVKTGIQKSLLNGHTHHVQSICFSPDGTTLASGSNDCSILLWDVETGKQKSKLDGHTHYVQSVCFSPDGTLLASGSCDQSIRLWEVKKGQIINPLEENYKDNFAKFFKPLQHISFSEDVNNNITIQHISQQPIFQAKGALILNGEFTNHLGMDLRKLFEQRGSFILETYLEQQKNKNKN
ncbi:unnamed protein product [Paramecium pentaurelia]|uniref:NACHT domain-containing protein n=1 Tax=Paramecium pentaurelia TaxID=43138 RepID=A0A8S1WNW9_9CILI|nr:unnamed protein product [Paramecium pentaurelia]